jgi:2-dehydropantoate 2-reductase
MTDKKIAVLGCGAIGGSVSADLTEAGLDVTVIDQWPEQVEKVRTDGLVVTMTDRVVDVKLDALHIHELAERAPEFDLAFIIVKSYDTRWVAALIEPYLKKDAIVVGLQNGMNNDTIAEIVGRERTLGAVVELSAQIFEPGILQRDTTRSGTWFAVGEFDGSVSPRLLEVQKIMQNFAKVDISEKIQDAKWTKLIANTMTMGPFGLLGLTNWEAKELPGMIDICVGLGRESMAVGEALGYEVQPLFGMTPDEFTGASDEQLIKTMQTLMQHVGGKGTTAPIHDYTKGRKSEMDLITGHVCRGGIKHDIRTPYNNAVAELDRQINEGETPMGPENFEKLQEMIHRSHNQ